MTGCGFARLLSEQPRSPLCGCRFYERKVAIMMDQFNVKPLGKREQFTFKCTRCGDCCRGIKESVMLESMDAYRLARLLRQTDPSIQMMDDMLLKYATPVPLTDNGFPIYVLKTLGEDDTCIFLKENRCAVYHARPRTCRLYPISVNPDEKGTGFEYLLCREKPHHFIGGTVRTKDWLRDNFKREDQEFVTAEYEAITKIGPLMNRISEHQQPQAIVALLFARYYDFDLDAPFMPQYRRNQERLIEKLRHLAAAK